MSRRLFYSTSLIGMPKALASSDRQAVGYARIPGERGQGVEVCDQRKFIKDLTMRDADFLVDEFDRVDCGVDTTIEIECPECFATQEIDLPFERTFFMPGRERMARRRDRSSSFLG